MAEGIPLTGPADVAAADGHAVRQRARDDAEQFLVAGGPADDQDLAEVRAERPHRSLEVRRQHGQLEPDPDRPPLTRSVPAVERQQAAGTLDDQHAGRGRRRGHGQEPPAAVLGLEPLAAVDPQARAPLDPVGGRPRDAERLSHRGGQQVSRAGRDHVGVRADHVDGAGAQVGHHRLGAGARRGERAAPGRGRLADRRAYGHGQQAGEQIGVRRGSRAGRPAQRRDEQRPAGTALPGGRRVGRGGQVHREQVVEIGQRPPGAEGPHGTDRPAGQPRARGTQRQPAAVRHRHPRLARSLGPRLARRCVYGARRRCMHGAYRRGEQANHGVGVVGQRPAQRDGVPGLGLGQPEPGGERHRVGQQAQRVPGRAHLDREQPAGRRGRRIDLVDDRQLPRQPVGHKHPLVAGHQNRANGRPGRQEVPQSRRGRVVAQPGRDQSHQRQS
ncbi:MAG TPA: hypothetical protein VKU77_11845 [Streptosporangiaceae bacterium]|nr:hypothetical protein [Streptosporangiaceae bacterium]